MIRPNKSKTKPQNLTDTCDYATSPRLLYKATITTHYDDDNCSHAITQCIICLGEGEHVVDGGISLGVPV